MRRAAPLAATAAAYVALAVLLFSGAWRHPTRDWVGLGGDPQQAIWFLRWTPYALGHGATPLLTDHLDYPDGVNLMWNTSLPLPGLLLSPVTLLVGPVAAYDLLATLAPALSAWCAFIALRRYAPAPAAALGGLVYGFGTFVMHQSLGHPNLAFAVTPPLALLLLDEMLVRRREFWPAGGAALGMLAAAQLLTGEEVLAETALVALVGVVALAAWSPRAEVAVRLRGAAASLALAAAVFGALAAYPLAVQFLGPQRVHGSLRPAGVYVTDVLNLAVPSRQLVAPARADAIAATYTSGPVEAVGYLGIPLLLLCAWAAVREHRRLVVRVAASLGLTAVVLSLGGHLHVGGLVTGMPLPWALAERLPLVRDVQPGRLMLYADLLAALLVAVLAGSLWRAGPGHAAPGALLVGASLVSLIPALPFPSGGEDVPGLFTGPDLARLPAGGTALVLPFTTSDADVAPMLWQAESGMRFRMPSGYVIVPAAGGGPGGPPPTEGRTLLERLSWEGRAPEVDAGVRAALADDLRRWGVSTVVVGPMPQARAASAVLSRLLGRPPENVGGAEVWWGVRPEDVLASASRPG